MKTIHKYPMPQPGQPSRWVRLPVGAEIVHVATQNFTLFAWCIVDTAALYEDRRFMVIGTGDEIKEGARHIRTWIEGAYVWHLFELNVEGT